MVHFKVCTIKRKQDKLLFCIKSTEKNLIYVFLCLKMFTESVLRLYLDIYNWSVKM